MVCVLELIKFLGISKSRQVCAVNDSKGNHIVTDSPWFTHIFHVTSLHKVKLLNN